MNPIYLDLHIHTSENPDSLVDSYDLDKLIEKIKITSNDSDYLISLTDHNTINKKVYLDAKNKITNLLLGVELHVRNYPDAVPYHCHIYFDKLIDEGVIDDINEKLGKLYIKKTVGNDDKIPYLEDIIKSFDSYDFLLLPHGGQSHSTFDKSIPEGAQFDSRIEKGIYYNQFDGFTARSNTRLERTINYFVRLGISEFTNLITCTDNYNPNNYPNAKDPKAEPFLPTWMLALPTFDGLRLSLSESSRLIYSHEKPELWSEYIRHVSHQNEFIDINVDLTSGLNVVIGGSSSGKTLFVDSLYNKIVNDYSDSNYLETSYDVESINVINPSGVKPHYIYQNYITKVVDNKDSDNTIDDIDIIRNVFPEDASIREKVNQGLLKLKKDLSELVDSVKTIEQTQKELFRISKLSHLITTEEVKDNILKKLLPANEIINQISYSESQIQKHIECLEEIDKFLEANPFIEHDKSLIEGIQLELLKAYDTSVFEKQIRGLIKNKKDLIDSELREENKEQQSKKQDFDRLLELIATYVSSLLRFKKSYVKILNYSIKCETKEVVSMGHKLFIANEFELNKEKFKEVLNHLLKTGRKIENIDKLEPEQLFEDNFKQQSPKVKDYDDFVNRVNSSFEELNKKTYKIITNDNRNFEKLSAGWKTSVILDLMLGYEGDMAPLIIDQPEDNLATKYINEGLIRAIKNIKTKKQIILVSHNATIPMLGDAQNVILCKNRDNKITIKSARLEGKIDNKSIVDYIAEITDGGKSSIKKRVKKYNLKKFN